MPSTVISTMSYNADTGILRIIFLSGKVYDYEDVPEDVFFLMKTSSSKGIFFNKHIKDQYNFRKVEEPSN